MKIMNIFRVSGDVSRLVSLVLLLGKLHASRSAADVSLKTQILYLLIFLARYSHVTFYIGSWYFSATEVTHVGLTAITIGMMRYQPSLRASYNASLDHFRMWMHGIIPSFVVTVVLFHMEDVARHHYWSWYIFASTFAHVLEALAFVPQLLVLRGCADAGRLIWVYVSLLVACRGFYGLNSFYIACADPRFHHHPALYVTAAVQLGIYVVFLVDWKYRTRRQIPRDIPPEEAGVMMEPSSAVRKPLLPSLRNTDGHFGDDESGNDTASAGGGTRGVETRPSRGQRQGGEVEERVEGVLMREREQASLAPGSGGNGGGGHWV